MKKIVRKVVMFSCETCGMEYDTKKEARACERLPKEEPKFQPGDLVRVIPLRMCSRPPNKRYRIEKARIGKLKELIPQPDKHRYYYSIHYRCPVCRNKEDHLYLGEDLKKI